MILGFSWEKRSWPFFCSLERTGYAARAKRVKVPTNTWTLGPPGTFFTEGEVIAGLVS